MYVRAALLCMAILAVLGDAEAAICPPSCVCSTTQDGLHKAVCSNVQDLNKFLVRRKHHNINVLDLSHNNITRLTQSLDRLMELVTLDLSTNGFTTIERYLRNMTKLVHLNLAHNRIRWISLSDLPKSLSSLDLTNNLLQNVPENLKDMPYLEHLELEGNPLECSCSNILLRDYLLKNNVVIDGVRCNAPARFKGYQWLELPSQEVCKFLKTSVEINSIEEQSKDFTDTARQEASDSLLLKFKPTQVFVDLEQGQTWVGDRHSKDYDNEEEDVVFLRAKRQMSDDIEGSGESALGTEGYDQQEYTTFASLSKLQMANDGLLESRMPTEDETEGSGESGSGFDGSIDTVIHDEFQEQTTEVKELYTNPVKPYLGNGVEEEGDTEMPDDIVPKRPSIYMGSDNWFNSTSSTSTTTEGAVGAEKIQIDNESEKASENKEDEKPVIHRTGTYVCIAIIVVLLVGLIGFALVKGQIRKRRDQRLQRQQKRDIERASKEMVDMNTSLLGKPAPTGKIAEKKTNGKYELVPTHETLTKKNENGDLTSANVLGKGKGSPRDNNQNREERPRSLALADVSAGVTPAISSPDSKKETDSLSSEEIFVPDSEEGPHTNGLTSDASHPLTKDRTVDSDYLSPSREYMPVYSPDMGRVRIKLTETPKPKTPVLVNRSRSNAGDIIVTPSIGQELPKSKT